MVAGVRPEPEKKTPGRIIDFDFWRRQTASIRERVESFYVTCLAA